MNYKRALSIVLCVELLLNNSIILFAEGVNVNNANGVDGFYSLDVPVVNDMGTTSLQSIIDGEIGNSTMEKNEISVGRISTNNGDVQMIEDKLDIDNGVTLPEIGTDEENSFGKNNKKEPESDDEGLEASKVKNNGDGGELNNEDTSSTDKEELINKILSVKDIEMATASEVGLIENIEHENATISEINRIAMGTGFEEAPKSEIVKEKKQLHGYNGVGATFKNDKSRNNVNQRVFGNLGDDLPSRYDAREKKNPNNNSMSVVPPIRTQWMGDCWAFATVALIETSIRQKGLVTTEAESNLSEIALTFNTYHLKNVTNNSAYAGKPGVEGNDYVERPESKYAYTSGGDPVSALLMASSYMGFVTENEDTAYEDCLSNIVNNDYLDPKYAFSSNSFVVGNAEIFADDYDGAKRKRAIMENGSVQLPVNMDINNNNTTVVGGECYFYSDNGKYINHTLIAVGWDDNVPKSYFVNKDGKSPSNNGAWLCRNSWGADTPNHKDGYVWLSYDDQALGDLFATVEAIKGDQYKYNYHYDTTNYYDYMSPTFAYDDGRLGNVFKVSNDEDQKLEAVNVALALYSGDKFDIEIYTKATQMSNPTDGDLKYTQSCDTKGRVGLLTIPLDNSVTLKKGTYFSIVVKAPSSGSISVYLDKTDINGYEDTYNEVAVGQSFKKISSSYSWVDYNVETAMQNINGKTYGTSLRIKGLANPATGGEPTKELLSISVDTTASTNKVKYKEGEPFNPSGLSIILTYSDGTTTPVSYSEGDTNWSFTPSGNLSSTDSSVTIKYLGKTTPQDIQVITLQSISAKLDTVKRTYAAGEKFNPTGLTIETKYSDNSTENVTYSDTTKSDFSFSKTDEFSEAGGVNQTVIVTYKGHTDNIPVTVKFLSSISVDTTASTNKVKYKEGEPFNPSGLSIILTYSDGTTTPVSYSEGDTNWSFTPSGNLSSTDSSVTIKYLGKTTPQDIQVARVTSISIMIPPTKLTYNKGQSFDPTGLVINVSYEDNPDESITYSDAIKNNFKFNGAVNFVLNTVGDNYNVSISYCGETVNQVVKVIQTQPINNNTSPTNDNSSNNEGGSRGSSSSNQYIVSNQGTQITTPMPMPISANNIEVKINVSFNAVPVSHNTKVVNWSKDSSGKWQLTYKNSLGQNTNAKNMWVNVNRIVNVNGISVEVKDYYFFDNKGEMLTGWIADSNNKKRFLETTDGDDLGKMVRGWKKINENYYYFDTNGFLFTNGITSDGYRVDDKGVWVK